VQGHRGETKYRKKPSEIGKNLQYYSDGKRKTPKLVKEQKMGKWQESDTTVASKKKKVLPFTLVWGRIGG